MNMRIGIDVGGTFTDVTAFSETRAEVVLNRKYLSDPREPMRVLADIARDIEAEFGSDAVSLVLHGSTVALNTLLEGKGGRVGLLTTAGFRDVYEIGRQWRGEEVFNIFAPPPKMLLRRRCIYEVRERLDACGEVIEPVNRTDIEAAVRALLRENVEAIAVAFLFSYANPAHEREAAEIIRSIAPDIYVALSSEVNPEWREYERTASTVVSGYIGPPVSRYLEDFEALFAGRFANCRTLMMKSDGGIGSAVMLSRAPIQTVMSGPVAGVIGSHYLADLKGIRNLISFDTGGTSSDMAVIPGQPIFKSEISIGRHPLRAPTVDIETIGAGGGSIASIELGGVLKVGPRSAGAVPGAACYARGGTEPTLTDALVVLGHLSSSALLDGRMPIDKTAAIRAIRDTIAAPLGLSLTEAAWGVLTVLVNNCTGAMRSITVERGYDPREFTLLPFGGMGPTIAGMMVGHLGIGRILVPRAPGTFSAWGMLVTDVHQEHSLTRLIPLDGTPPDRIEYIFSEIENAVTDDLLRERFPPERIRLLRFGGMRYRGQSYEVSVPVPRLATADDLALLAQRFHEAHQRRYGHMARDETIEIVNFKVTGIGEIAKPVLTKAPRGATTPLRPIGGRAAFFGGDAMMDTPVYQRATVVPGNQLDGPAIVEEPTSTVVVYPGQRATVDDFLNLEIEVGAATPTGLQSKS